MTPTPSPTLAPTTSLMAYDDWGQVDAALSSIIGPRGVAALHQRMRHRFGTDTQDAHSTAVQRQVFWSLTAELLGESLTGRLFQPVSQAPAYPALPDPLRPPHAA